MKIYTGEFTFDHFFIFNHWCFFESTIFFFQFFHCIALFQTMSNNTVLIKAIIMHTKTEDQQAVCMPATVPRGSLSGQWWNSRYSNLYTYCCPKNRHARREKKHSIVDWERLEASNKTKKEKETVRRTHRILKIFI